MECRMKPRKGTANKGQEYEILLPALFSLKFLENPNIEDFILRSNIKGFECLDDLIISLYKIDGQEENYAFQLKHKEKQELTPTVLEADKKKNDFNILKYCEGFSKIDERDSYRFIIYTNGYFDPEELDKVSKFDIDRDGTCPGKNYFFFSSSKNLNTANIYNFQVNKNTKITDIATVEVYKSFFKKFAFYAHQKNWQEVQGLIIEKFRQIFRTTDNSVAMAYIAIFKVWKLHEYSTVEISKQDLTIKILDLILSPYILTPTTENSDNQNFSLLKRTFTKYDFVLVNDLDDASVAKLVSNPHLKEGEDIIRLGKELKLLTKKDVCCKRETEIKQKIGYYLKGKPIAIKIHEANANTIVNTITKFKKTGDKFHFILTGDACLLKRKVSGFKIFETLDDLRPENNYQEIIDSLNIFFKGKKWCYKELFASNNEVTKKIKIKNIFEMMYGNFQLKLNEEKLQDPYIPRSISITIIKIESIDEINNDVVVISHKANLKIIDSLKSVVRREFIEVTKYLQEEIYSTNIVVYQDTLSAGNLFDEICQKNSTSNVHHFTVYDEEFLQWMSTRGSIREVKKCEFSSEKYISESEIYEKLQNRINVIVASPGMGKSELLKKLKNTCPSKFFPILVNLKEHDAFFKHEHEDKEVLNYFLENPSDDFLLEIIRNSARNKSIMFFFDGLDELQHENVIPALEQIKHLSATGFKIWLTSRSHLKEVIEENFDIFTVDIKSFTDQEQRNFIKGRMKDNENVEILTNEIFNNIETILENREILDLPLQLFMITSILTEFSNEVTNDMFVLTHMFQYFFDGRYRNFFKKSKCGHWEPLSKIVNDSKKYRLKQYQIGALKSCLTREEFQLLNVELETSFVRQIQTDGDFLGIVSKITSGSVIFHHDITATYFAALWLAENFGTVREFLKRILFNKKYIYLRLMFDMILAEDFPAHVATLYRNATALQEHTNEILKLDKGGRSVLHLACSHGCRYEYLSVANIQHENVSVGHLKNMQRIDEKSREVLENLLEEGDLFKTDKVFGWNCFDFCERTFNMLPLEIILEKNDHNKFGEAQSAILKMDLVKNKKTTILYYSAIFSYVKLFQNIFKDVNLKSNEVACLLQIATMWNNWKIVNILLDNNADIHTKTKYGQTILHLASSMGHTGLVWLLLVKEADVNAVDQFGRTPLHYAAANGHILTVKKLAENGAKVDAFDKYGRTPLHLAVEKGNKKLTKILIDENSAQVNKTAWNGWGCLQLAIIEGDVNMVELLSDRGADFEKMDKYGTKPLHVAAKRPNIEILEIVLKKSTNVDVITSDGRTGLHFAAESGNMVGTEHLLKKGASINERDGNGRSILHWAVIAKHLEIVDFLLKNDVDVNVVDNNGRNCLQWAAEGGNLSIVKSLLNKMTKLVNEQAKNGSTALHWAATNGHNDIVSLLLSAGANVDTEDTQCRTPLCWAALEGHTKTVELLLTKNAKPVFINGKPALEFARTKKNHV